MRVSRYILVLLALLTCGMMAAAEVPEMFSLSDDTSNDFVCHPLGEQRLVGSCAQPLAERPTLLRRQSEIGKRTGLIGVSFSSAFPDQSSSPSLPMLGIQRK